MSYKKTTWINDSTPVNADNMNKIEEGIDAAHNEILSVQNELTKLSGNTETSVEALETSVEALETSVEALETSAKDLDERVQSVEEDAEVVREKIELAPMGVISFDDISNPLLAATQALKEAKKFFPDNDVSEYKFVFRERKTGDLYYGTIGNLGTYESAPELLKKVGNPLSDYDEKIAAASTAANSALNVKEMAERGEFTPKKGVDYYTPQEKDDMTNEVEETVMRYIAEGRELEDQGDCDISVGDSAELGVSHHIKYRIRHSNETITLYSDTSADVVIALGDEVYYGALKEGIPLILPKDITEQNEFENLNELRPVESGEVEKMWVPGCDVIVGFYGDMPKSCVVSPYIDALLNSIEDDAENPKPAAYVEVENIESVSEAQKILKAVTASGLVPEEVSPQEYPAYVYDRNTKFLYKCSAKEVTAIYTSLIAGGTPEMPEKICYLGDIVSKQYVDDLFQSIIDGNEVAY